nr:MAG TPA: hypothetical protein [Caudoviricetes sp.]
MHFAVFRRIVRHQCFLKHSATYAVWVQHNLLPLVGRLQGTSGVV